MFNQFNVSRSGFGWYQKLMFNITNNISNASTPGFKQTEARLATLFPYILHEAEMKYADEENLNPYSKKGKGIELAMGVRMESLRTNFAEGALEITNDELDVAISGHGFFQFRDLDGEMVFSRSGNFTKDIDGNITSQSGLELDPPLRVPQNTRQITFNQDGRVFALIGEESTPQEVGQVIVARFEKPEELKNVGGNFYKETQDSGEAVISVPAQGTAGQLVQFSRESSNVDVIKEMMNMIMTKNGLRLMGKAMEAGGDMTKVSLSIVS